MVSRWLGKADGEGMGTGMITMTSKGYVETYPRVKRYIGEAVVTIEYYVPNDHKAFDGRWYYRGEVRVGEAVWKFGELGSGVGGIRDAGGCDSAVAYDEMAASAVAFGSSFEPSGFENDAAWQQAKDLASTIEDAVTPSTGENGGYMVRRSVKGPVRGPYGA